MIIDHAVRKASSTLFFHHPDFIFRNPRHKIISFPAADEPANASIHFTIEGTKLVSLPKSPFGGFVLREKTQPMDMKHLIDSVICWAKEHAMEAISIRGFPVIYSPKESDIIHEVLTEAGFEAKYKDINQVVTVESQKDLALNKDRLRRLNGCMNDGFVFRKLTARSLEAAYALFAESRNNKRYSTTMTLHELTTMFEQFPDHYLLFGVFDGEKMIAASVSILVSPDILYCFYLGDSLSYRKKSPVTMLIHGIYDFCVTNTIHLLDLGTSGENGVVTEGVYDFKKSLGCTDSHKFTFCLQL